MDLQKNKIKTYKRKVLEEEQGKALRIDSRNEFH